MVRGHDDNSLLGQMLLEHQLETCHAFFIEREGTTIIMVTHDPELAAMASRKIELMDGRISETFEQDTIRVAAN